MGSHKSVSTKLQRRSAGAAALLCEIWAGEFPVYLEAAKATVIRHLRAQTSADIHHKAYYERWNSVLTSQSSKGANRLS